MKKKILFVFIILSVFISGCNFLSDGNNDTETIKDTSKETLLNFNIEKKVLSMGYQSIKQNVEMINKSKNPNLLINLGIVKCSDAVITKITSKNNLVKIYTSSVSRGKTDDLFIPQLTISLPDIDINKLKDVTFEIIPTNYDPIQLPFNKVDILNNVFSQFKIATNTKPIVKLIETKDGYIWDIKLDFAFDKSKKEYPIVSFEGTVNAMDGEILTSSITDLSTYIDEGTLLDTFNNKYVLYKKNNTTESENSETLWIYNINDQSTKKLYTTHNAIFDGSFGQNGRYISVIDNNNGLTDIFLIDLHKGSTEKIPCLQIDHTWNIKWKNNNLYFINNDGNESSTLYKYNINTNNVSTEYVFDTIVSEFDILHDVIIYKKFDDNNTNSPIYILEKDQEPLEIANGFDINLLDKDTLVYMKKELNKNELYIYNLIDNSIEKIDTLNIKNYNISSNSLIIFDEDTFSNIIKIIKYSMKSKELSTLFYSLSSDTIYSEDNLFVNISPPISEVENKRIYMIPTK